MEKQIGLTRRKLLQGMLAVAVLAMLPMMALAAPSNIGAGNISHAASARQSDIRRQHGVATR